MSKQHANDETLGVEGEKFMVNHHGQLFAGNLISCAFRTARECRQQVKNWTKFVEIVEYHHDHIWNRNENCIQISTNMPGIGLLICEIAVENVRNVRKQTDFLLSKFKPRVWSVNTASFALFLKLNIRYLARAETSRKNITRA